MSLKNYATDLSYVIDAVLEQESTLSAAAAALVTSLRSGSSLLTCGNGGSASQAQHLVTELLGRYRSNRQSLRAVYLGGDASLFRYIATHRSIELS